MIAEIFLQNRFQQGAAAQQKLGRDGIAAGNGLRPRGGNLLSRRLPLKLPATASNC